MFFKNDSGENVIQFGCGDILVCPGVLDYPHESIVSLSLVPSNPKPIGHECSFGECVLDTSIGVHTRLVFTNILSIDVLIDALREVKKIMVEDR